MANFDSVESAREFFYKDLFAVNTGITLDELTDDEAVCSLELNDVHRNAYGGVMGGVIFTLADFAFAVASNWEKPGVVGLNCDASFIGVPKTERIIAEARLIKDGRTICCYNVDIRDEQGNPVAAVQCVGFRKG